VEHTGESMVNMEIREKGEGFNYGHEAEEATHIFSQVVVSYISVDTGRPTARYRPLGEKRVKWALEAGLVTTRRIGDASRQPLNQIKDAQKCNLANYDSPKIIIVDPWIIIY
jgi:hypothetical protein